MDLNQVYQGDCLEVNDKIQNGSVDLILCDLPYGNMNNIGDSDTIKHGMKDKTHWDFAIKPENLYEVANRILRMNGKMVLFGQEPYTSQLITRAHNNIPFCYRMIWKKDHFANSLIAKKAPVSYFEDIIVFSKTYDLEGLHPLRSYFKIVKEFMNCKKSDIIKRIGQRADHVFRTDSTQYDLCTEKTYNELIKEFEIAKMEGFKTFAELSEINVAFNATFNATFNLWEGNKFKGNVLEYKKDYEGLHPTQKPVALIDDLVRTFSNENDLVVDLTAGSGTVGLVCEKANRKYILIEKEANYCEIARNRIQQFANSQTNSLFNL